MNDSFDPTPRLKSSPIPILFIPFKNNENKCNHCRNEYSESRKLKQKYCKNCLSLYVKNIKGNNNTYLDIYITKHETRIATNDSRIETNNSFGLTNFHTRNIQEWCEYCSEVSYFRQVVPNDLSFNPSRKTDCELCGKLISQLSLLKYGCSDCYLISFGWIESTLNKNTNIPILCLPYWDNYKKCIVCSPSHELRCISSDCQKYCLSCYTTYIGCRYCLTTNIIFFGITDQSQCRKCKRISFIDIDIAKVNTGNINIDGFAASIIKINSNLIANMNLVNQNCNPLDIYRIINNNNRALIPIIKYILYSQIKNLKEIARGGFGIIYKATWLDSIDVAIKKFHNSQIIDKYFLNELSSLNQFYSLDHIICYHGITQDPVEEEYMLIMEYANGGTLHNYLQKKFANITWHDKLTILFEIASGLSNIHRRNFIHRDFHSGNILLSEKSWKIGDLGLSQHANNTLSNNEIYGVIPYIAPEIFKGVTFSKESDIYSFGMVMWELTTGCKPFANIDHDIALIYEIIDGKRPEITNDTPKFFADLMKRCWDSDPLKRPSIEEIWQFANKWKSIILKFRFDYSISESIEQAEKRRLELIQSKKLGPEFTEKSHSKAIFTSRALSSLISKSLTTNLTSIFSMKQEYITKEIEMDIDINTQSLSSQYINSNIPRKRNIKELKFKDQNNRKQVKTDKLD
ncbi:kinase-like domain-containing protein [Glomus cerebriforme]|uniref:Kinase-like domain-containing protein n=1 Tax=Glomus cerebriforme TaxID=658196 RepID=A0A397SBY2_9GLOM|nr:kinase-like domain-containing protein [Glomus cerebriforme]